MATTYTTKQGDMWDSISFEQYGSESFTDDLMNANMDYRKYYTFPAGIVLDIPEIDTTTKITTPPWKAVPA